MTIAPEDSFFLVAGFIVCFAIIIYQNRKVSKERKEKAAALQLKQKYETDVQLLKAEHLKFRLQPHTLNNILASLKAVSNKLNKGMDALSETLDYILYQGDAHFVSVESELDFVRRYLALNDLFLTEIDSVKLNESEVNTSSPFYRQKCIPHLVTAYFLENAFKHGDISHPEFLVIKVILNDTHFEMHVVNRIKAFSMRKKSGGIGLQNMKNRLELLLRDKHEVKFNCNETEYHSLLRIQLT